MLKGKVKWFNYKKGYGFIQTETGQDVFVHHSEIAGEGFKTLKEGEDVELIAEKTSKGFKALNVVKKEKGKTTKHRELLKK